MLSLTLTLSLLTLGSCSDEEPVTTTQVQRKGTILNAKSLVEEQSIRQRQTKDTYPYCFRFEYPVAVQWNSEELIHLENDIQLNELVQTQGIDWLLNALQYPVLVSTVVTSESNLGDSPVTFEGNNGSSIGNTVVTSESNLGDSPITMDGNNGSPVGNNIVTSESNLGDVPKKVTISTPEDLLRLLLSCQ